MIEVDIKYGLFGRVKSVSFKGNENQLSEFLKIIKEENSFPSPEYIEENMEV